MCRPICEMNFSYFTPHVNAPQPKMTQNGPEGSEWPRVAQNDPKWPTCPNYKELTQKTQNGQHAGPFWAWPRTLKISKNTLFSGTLSIIAQNFKNATFGK